MDELEERDILWPDQNNQCTGLAIADQMQSTSQESPSIYIRGSAPIAIPSSPREVGQRNILEMESDEHDEGGSNNHACKKIIPPHVIVARRFADRMFSVCFGNGRTLRGRDLVDFRNSIFRMTGFIE
ncbi:protein S40-1-like [Carex rostrata]